jgi:hypothetical protein
MGNALVLAVPRGRAVRDVDRTFALRTVQPRPADYEENRQEYDYARDFAVGELRIWEPAYQETDDEILNDVANEKLRLWEWLDQGVEPLDRC